MKSFATSLAAVLLAATTAFHAAPSRAAVFAAWQVANVPFGDTLYVRKYPSSTSQKQAASDSRTMASRRSAGKYVRVTEPTRLSMIDITDSCTSSASPLVVTVLCAHRMLTDDTRRASTMHASAAESCSTRSMVCWRVISAPPVRC